MFKKLLKLFLAMALVFALFACTTTNPSGDKEGDGKTDEPYDFSVPFETVKNKIPDLNNVTEKINLPKTVGEVLFVWSSSDESVVSKDGKVTRGLEDKEVTLTAVMKYNGQTATLSFTVKVPKLDEEAIKGDPIATALEGKVGDRYTVRGTVVAVGGSGFYLFDGTDYILAYLGYSWAKDLKVGDIIIVTGGTSIYHDTVQFSVDVTYVVLTNEAVTHPEAKELDVAAMEAYKENLAHDFVKLTGILSVSGNYYNVIVEGTEMQGSIVGPLFDDILNMNNKEVTVYGYVLYLTSSDKYLNIIATAIEGDTTPAEVTEATIAEILAGENGMYKTTATVAALNAQGFLLFDNGKYLFTYIGSKFVQDVEVGDKVTVSGMVGPYNGSLKQFSNDPDYKVIESGTYTDPEPVALDGEAIGAFVNGEDFCVKYVEVEGTLNHTGNYFNLKIKNCDFTGSLAYPIETAKVDAFNGKYVKVTGYTLYISSKVYLNILITNIEETAEPEPDPTVEATIAEIIAAGKGTYKTNGFVAVVAKTGFLLEESGSFLFVYEGANWTANVQVGDYVTIEGEVITYSEKLQYDNTAKYSVGTAPEGKTPTAKGDAKELTVELLDACIDEINVEYVSLVGKLSVSGNSLNVTVTGAKAVGSIVTPVEDITALNGKFIKITGYTLYLTGGKYVNIICDSIEETEVTVTVTEATVSEIVAGELGTYKTTGTVVAKGSTGFLITDGAEYLFVYTQGQDIKSVKVGSTVEVEGDITVYYGAKQFSQSCTFKVTGEGTFPAPSFKELTAAQIDAYKDITPFKVDQVKFTGTLSISGAYFNLTIEGATSTGSIVGPAILIDSLNGKEITVEGSLIYLSGSSSQYFSVLAVNIYYNGELFAGDEPAIPDDLKEGTEFDFAERFEVYAKAWSNSYGSKEVSTQQLGYAAEYTITLSNASKQTTTITDVPVMASKNTNQYVTIAGDFTGVKSVTFSLVQWTTKTFKSIKLQYTTDGTNWIDCSDEIVDNFAEALTSNIAAETLATATAVRLVINGGNNKSNVQLGVSKITLEK